MYPRKKTIAWMILNIIKTAGPDGIRRKDIMKILFKVLGREPYDTTLDRGWYCSYFTDPDFAINHRRFWNVTEQYGIVPKLCKKVNGKYWVLKPTWG
jgi:hypothetical protein